jgi:AraC-like DNA-binding protein
MEEKFSKRNQNKSLKRAVIIDTAERLFLEKDFESISMDEVANEAGLTKRTLYQYFISKEDLFYAVVLKGEKLLFSLWEEVIENRNNALEKIRLINKAYCQFYIDNPSMLRIMNYQPDNILNCKASPSYQEVVAMKNTALCYYNDIVDAGKSDGSINKNLDTKKAVYFGLLSSMGLINLISMMDKSYIWQGEMADENDFLYFSMELLTNALK